MSNAATVSTNPISHDFASRTYPLKVFAGKNALEALPNELKNLGVNRALIVCGRSVHDRSPLTQRIGALLGERLVAVFADLSEGAPSHRIEDAAKLGLEVQADAIIAVGAGSVLKGARVVAMLMGEGRPLVDMATTHVDGHAPVTKKLLAPKVPIFNVLTSPTSAQNRGGSAVRHEGEVHHLEFFDPKTRPAAIFWDSAALATAPVSLVRSTSFETYWWALMCMGAVKNSNPLVQASRYQAWKLAKSAYPRLHDVTDDAARIELCAASLLQNRDEEDGGRPLSCHILTRAAYAVAVAMFNRHPGITQSHGYAAMAPAVIRRMGHLCPEVTADIASALGVNVHSDDPQLPEHVATVVQAHFDALGWSSPLRNASIPVDQAPTLMKFALKNFNANHDSKLNEHTMLIQAAIEDAIAQG
ncbi:iron-containing alcohol dehydrogenase [Acidovorax delafieldii]|uniref:iron-containing alcohol dehydrogenase n=1 Tax=Acidovorax delafieldii TaxID=47920 RepID=UPI003ECCF838